MACNTTLGPQSGTPAWWNARYDSGEIPWDTGIVPPEVCTLVESAQVTPGWALDLGCGSGVSSRYLAEHGYRVVGLDLAMSALRRARLAAEARGLSAYFCLGDVTELGFLSLQAVLAVDIGCYHAVPVERRQNYIASLARCLAHGALYLLYAFEPTPSVEDGPAGIGPRDVACFVPWFTLRSAQHGHDRARLAAWYLFQRA